VSWRGLSGLSVPDPVFVAARQAAQRGQGRLHGAGAKKYAYGNDQDQHDFLISSHNRAKLNVTDTPETAWLPLSALF